MYRFQKTKINSKLVERVHNMGCTVQEGAVSQPASALISKAKATRKTLILSYCKSHYASKNTVILYSKYLGLF